MAQPAHIDGNTFFLTSVVALIQDRLDQVKQSSGAALADIGRGDVCTGIDRLRELEPALFEAQALIQAAVALGCKVSGRVAQADAQA